MPSGDVETYHEDNHWKNKIEGQDGDVGTYEDREVAVSEGRNLPRCARSSTSFAASTARSGSATATGTIPATSRDSPKADR
jgi:hypothetical protein